MSPVTSIRQTQLGEPRAVDAYPFRTSFVRRWLVGFASTQQQACFMGSVMHAFVEQWSFKESLDCNEQMTCATVSCGAQLQVARATGVYGYGSAAAAMAGAAGGAV